MGMKQKESVPLIEQETDIIIDPIAKRASVYSCIPNTMKQLYKMAEEHEEAHLEDDNIFGVSISVPQSWIKIKPPIKRVLTEEQKAASAKRLADMRNKKKE